MANSLGAKASRSAADNCSRPNSPRQRISARRAEMSSSSSRRWRMLRGSAPKGASPWMIQLRALGSGTCLNSRHVASVGPTAARDCQVRLPAGKPFLTFCLAVGRLLREALRQAPRGLSPRTSQRGQEGDEVLRLGIRQEIGEKVRLVGGVVVQDVGSPRNAPCRLDSDHGRLTEARGGATSERAAGLPPR